MVILTHFISGFMAYIATVVYADHVDYDEYYDPVDITHYEAKTLGSLQLMQGASVLSIVVFLTHGFALFLVVDSAYQPIPNSPVN